MNDSNKNSLDRLSELSDAFNEAFRQALERIDAKWDSLSKEDQLDYFCAVVKRIHQGDVEEGRSYRGVLYGTFGFGPEAYAIAQMSGYLDIHNMITDPEQERKLLSAFSQFVCQQLNNSVTDPEQLVSDFRNQNPNKDEF